MRELRYLYAVELSKMLDYFTNNSKFRFTEDGEVGWHLCDYSLLATVEIPARLKRKLSFFD